MTFSSPAWHVVKPTTNRGLQNGPSYIPRGKQIPWKHTIFENYAKTRKTYLNDFVCASYGQLNGPTFEGATYQQLNNVPSQTRQPNKNWRNVKARYYEPRKTYTPQFFARSQKTFRAANHEQDYVFGPSTYGHVRSNQTDSGTTATYGHHTGVLTGNTVTLTGYHTNGLTGHHTGVLTCNEPSLSFQKRPMREKNLSRTLHWEIEII